MITKAKDWWEAYLRNERLPEHELAWCELCGEASIEAVCPRCIEIKAEEAVHERSRPYYAN